MAKITAERHVRHLEASGFVLMKRPPGAAPTTAGMLPLIEWPVVEWPVCQTRRGSPICQAMCNLYAVTKGQQAIRELTRAMHDRVGISCGTLGRRRHIDVDHCLPLRSDGYG